MPDISIGDTICDPEHIEPMEQIEIEEPTLSMNFHVNSSPLPDRAENSLRVEI